MTAIQWLSTCDAFSGMFSKDRSGVASNSEKRRWLRAGAVLVNGAPIGENDTVPNRIESLVFFPKPGKSRITML